MKNLVHSRIAALLLLISIQSLAFALPAGIVNSLKPVVEAKSGGATAWSPVKKPFFLQRGQRIRTGPKGVAELFFNDGTKVDVKGGTEISIAGGASQNDGMMLTVFGSLAGIFVRAKGPMQIRTAAGIAAVTGTEFQLTLLDENTTVLTVAEGGVRFFNAQGAVQVGANQQSTAMVGSAPTPPVAVDASGLMQWTYDVAALPVEFEIGGAKVALGKAEADAAANPNNVAAQLSLGHALRASGDANGAVAAFQKAGQLAPADDAPRAGLVVALLAKSDLAGAQNSLQNAPATPLMNALRGLVALRGNDVPAAIRLLEDSAKADPRLHQAHALLALARLSANQPQEAKVAAEKAVALAPNSSQAQSSLALALFYGGKSKEAAASAKRAVQLDPDSPFAQLALGQALLAQGQASAARAAFMLADAQAPGLPLVQLNLAQAYAKLDMPKRAEKNFQLVLKTNPNSAAAHTGLGSLVLAAGKDKESLVELNRAVALEPGNRQAHANLAEYFIVMGDFSAAEKQLSGLTGGYPADGNTYIKLSAAALFKQQLLKAHDYGRRAVKLLPDSAPAHYQLGRVYREMERTVQAEMEFRMAVILDPNHAAARFALGLAREVAESGGDFSQPLGAIASSASGPRQALNIQNLATPGAEDRIQAAIQDPTVIRSASRSFGENQIEGGFGEGDTNHLNFSNLQDQNNGRSAFGLTVGRNHTDGIRTDADLTQENIGFFQGRKKADNPSGFFLLGQVSRSRIGQDTGPIPQFPGTALRTKRTLPSLIWGYNHQTSESQRTRFLVGFDHPKNESAALDGTVLNTKGTSVHGELRHDFSAGKANSLSAGVSFGARRFDLDTSFPGFAFSTNRRLEKTSVYLRNLHRFSPRFKVTGELKVERLENQSVLAFGGAPPILTTTKNTAGLPSFVANYQLSRASALRFRARGLMGSVDDFDLLAPTDVFLYGYGGVPSLDVASRGSSYEVELSHHLANGSLLRLGAFQRNLNAVTLESGEAITDAKFRAVRARLEGVLTGSTTYFVSTNFNDAKGTADLTGFGGPIDPAYQLTRVPRFSTEAGLQLLSGSGWFLQPTIAYIGSRLQPGFGGPRDRLGGFSLVNLRAGKRTGLRSTIFIEGVNLTNRNYVSPGGFLGEQQPGRQFRIGASTRF